jgi:hypothetical protein
MPRGRDDDSHEGEVLDTIYAAGQSLISPPKTYKKLGRLTTCTPEVADCVAKIVALGVTIPHACRAIGLAPSVWDEWNRRGRDDIANGRESPYRDWVEALSEARAAATTTLIAKIATSPDWRAAAWLLEKLDKNFRPQPQRLEPSPEQKAADQIAGLSTGEILKMVDQLKPANATAQPAMLGLPAGEKPKTD